MAFHADIAALARDNNDFRREVVTGAHSQVVLMSIPPGGEIGEEVHKDTDQTLVFVAGQGEATLDGARSPISANSLYFVPAGARHNFVNTGQQQLKLFTIYAPAHHAPGTVHKTKADADAAEAAGTAGAARH
ncbi:MAG TPA: cupin domain-containing protein [Thermomicrobiales bacterium]|nr:cupin domain-containing protein [Thermomicrobiales bacterium]